MASDMFLKLEGIDGESTDDKHKGEMEILSFSWGCNSQASIGSASTGGGASKATFQEFQITKMADLASPKMALISANGGHIKTGKISIRKAGGDAGQMDYQTYELETIFITGMQFSSGGDGLTVESLTLAPTKFKWKYSQQDDTGALTGNTQVYVDRATNKAT
jgi:type VI secretion system secreted protein Hcp